MVLPARRDGVEERRVRGVHPNERVLPQTHAVPVLGGQVDPSVRRSILVPVPVRVDDATEGFVSEGHSGMWRMSGGAVFDWGAFVALFCI